MEYTEPTRHTARRKEHVCDWCGEKIVIGWRYRKWRCFDAGHAQTVKVHEECYGAMIDQMDGYEIFFDMDQPRPAAPTEDKGA